MDTNQIVTPFIASTKSKFNYDVLVSQFGLKILDDTLLNHLKEISNDSLHYFLERGIFYAHQDLDKIIEAKLNGKEIYIYTGRGPSAESLHLGHMVPMLFTVWLQKIFDCWVVIEMSDEEKYYFKDGSLDEFMMYTEGNAKDIIACGFNPEKTFIFSSFKYQRYMMPLVSQINKKTSVHTANKVYGFAENNSVGQLQWGSYQIAPSMSGAFPHLFGDRKDVYCLVPCAVDQAPYFRIARDLAESMGYPKPALVCSKFLVGLQGTGEKASTTAPTPPIFLNDSSDIIFHKIKKYAFSGGKDTKKEHMLYGANLDVDVSYIYLTHFMEDTIMLADIADKYSKGIMFTSEVKKILLEELVKLIEQHKLNRNSITDELYNKFFTIRVNEKWSDFFHEFNKKYVNIDVSVY